MAGKNVEEEIMKQIALARMNQVLRDFEKGLVGFTESCEASILVFSDLIQDYNDSRYAPKDGK